MSARSSVAREAARLMYMGYAEEYMQAKEAAAASLGARALPSNREVADQLDELAEASEPDRASMLVEMRRAALAVMVHLRELEPRLIGSVWRGTARRGSDIDIVLYHESPTVVRERLAERFKVTGVEHARFFSGGLPRRSTHIKLELSGFGAEVVVRPPSEREPERCEVYGDMKTGLGVAGLMRVLEAEPLRRFIPR